MAETVLFDLDGTLTDSKPGIVNSTLHALRRLNDTTEAAAALPRSESLDFILGPPLRESFAKLVGPAHVEALLGFYRERYQCVGIFENSVFSGIPQALADLTTRYRLFVATSKNEADARRIMDHYDLARFFTGIYGAQRDGTRSNKGELIAYVVKRHDIDPRRAAMIGDRKHDALGARNNDLWPIGVLWGYGSREELGEAGADPLLATPSEIAPALEAGFAARGIGAG